MPLFGGVVLEAQLLIPGFSSLLPSQADKKMTAAYERAAFLGPGQLLTFVIGFRSIGVPVIKATLRNVGFALRAQVVPCSGP